jgi:hypothetical protein
MWWHVIIRKDDAHDDTKVEDTNFETFQFEVEDGELVLGLNCLVCQSFTPVEANIEQVIISDITKEITCDDID